MGIEQCGERRLSRRAVVVGSLGTVALSGCAAEAVPSTATTTWPPQDVAFNDYWVEEAGQVLVVLYGGGLGDRITATHVAETASTVRVWATLGSHVITGDGIPAIGVPLHDRVRLKRPLGSRRVITLKDAAVRRRWDGPAPKGTRRTAPAHI